MYGSLHAMPIEPTIIDRAAQPYVGFKRTVTMATMSAVIDRIPDLFAHLAQHAVAPVGPPFLRYDVIDMERELIVEAGVPISPDDLVRAIGVAGSEDSGGSASGEPYGATLPAGRYVDVTYHGHYDDLIRVTGELLAWAADRSLVWDSWPTVAGEAWGCRLEHYLTDPAEQPDMTPQLTELTFRLAD